MKSPLNILGILSLVSVYGHSNLSGSQHWTQMYAEAIMAQVELDKLLEATNGFRKRFNGVAAEIQVSDAPQEADLIGKVATNSILPKPQSVKDCKCAKLYW